MYFKETYNFSQDTFLSGEYLARYGQRCIYALSNVGLTMN